ncbi:MAG TPA: hypothetical protein DCP37_09510 [Dehalococcoidia bacterium]|nr:hypothetical protein [Dehalococcoidia bacterium]
MLVNIVVFDHKSTDHFDYPEDRFRGGALRVMDCTSDVIADANERFKALACNAKRLPQTPATPGSLPNTPTTTVG